VITTQDIIIKEINKAKGDLGNYDCQYEIARVMQDEVGYDDWQGVGYDGTESKGYGKESEAEKIASVTATAYLISQGYDIPADASYDLVWDTLGNEAEDVYQQVWCTIMYDAADIWVRW
jgi:hypothetical protein